MIESFSTPPLSVQRYIQTDIKGYRPAPGDLSYPEKLIVLVSRI